MGCGIWRLPFPSHSEDGSPAPHVDVGCEQCHRRAWQGVAGGCESWPGLALAAGQELWQLPAPCLWLMEALGSSLRRISWRGGGRWSGCCAGMPIGSGTGPAGPRTSPPSECCQGCWGAPCSCSFSRQTHTSRFFPKSREFLFKHPRRTATLSMRNTSVMKKGGIFSAEFLKVFLPSLLLSHLLAIGLG